MRPVAGPSLSLLLTAMLLTTSLPGVAAAQGVGATQTLTVGGAGLSQERVLDLRALLQEARADLRKLHKLKSKGGRCDMVKERAELIGEKTAIKLERALMLLDQPGGTATVNVHMNVQDPHQGHLDHAVVVAEVPVVEEPPPVMTPGEVGRLSSAVASEAFADDKLSVLRLAMAGLLMRAADVSVVLGGFQFGEDKLKALQLMAGYIYDRENSFQILQAFTFSEEKKRAQQILQ
jgi:hypothetical protein